MSSSLFPSIYFASVIEVFFRCYFRITIRSMLRSQDELNTILLNTKSLLIATKQLVFFFGQKSINNVLHQMLF